MQMSETKHKRFIQKSYKRKVCRERLMIVSGLLALISLHWLAYALMHLIRPHHSGQDTSFTNDMWVDYAVALVGLLFWVLFAIVSYKLHVTHTHEQDQTAMQHVMDWMSRLGSKLFAILSAIGALWIAFGLEPPLLSATGSYGMLFGCSLILFLTSIFIALRLSDLFPIFDLAVKNKSSLKPPGRSKHGKAKKAIIFLVSPEHAKTQINFDQELQSWQLKAGNDGKVKTLKIPTLGNCNSARLSKARDLANGVEPYWTWQQIFRGLVPHVASATEELPEVWLLGSCNRKDSLAPSHGSFADLTKLRKLLLDVIPGLKVYFISEDIANSAEFNTAEESCKNDKKEYGVDFEDFDAITNALEMALHRITLRSKNRNKISWFPLLEQYYCRIIGTPASIHYRDIIIDATGGQKTTSIAAASITMKSRVDFQYVQTQGDQVLQFSLKFLERHSH